MSRTQRFRPTGAVVATGAVLGAIALAGCSAGQITQTDTQVPAVVGAQRRGRRGRWCATRTSSSASRPRAPTSTRGGGAAPLKMSIVNSGIQPDRLVSASSPAAASVDDHRRRRCSTRSGAAHRGRRRGGPPRRAAPAASPVRSGAPAAAGPTRPERGRRPAQRRADHAPGDEIGGAGQEEGQAPAAEPSSAAPATPRAGTGGAEAGGREGQVVLTGLTEDVRAGLTYPVVLNFERAGQVTLDRAGRAPGGAARGRARRVTARARAVRGGFRCAECGHQAAQWVGRCPSCQAWGSLEQSAPAAGRVAGAGSRPARRPPRPAGSPTSPSTPPAPAPPACPNWTGCWAAG